MKFTSEDYKELKSRVNKITQEQLDEHIKLVKKQNEYKDLEIRITWDVYHATSFSRDYLNNKYGVYKSPYKDTHLETATKKAIKELGLIIKWGNIAWLKAN